MYYVLESFEIFKKKLHISLLFFFVKIKFQVHTFHPLYFFTNVSNALGIHKGHNISGLVV